MSEQRAPLAAKDGVSPNKIWLPHGEWLTIFDYLCWRFPQIKATEWSLRFQSKEVVFENGETISVNSPYQSERHLYFYHHVPDEVKVPFEEKIVYQNENIIVADKPHFLPVAPSGKYLHHTLLIRLRKKLGNDDIQLCHRLDRETAGLVLLTKKESVRAAYQSLFANRQILKTYHAIAQSVDLVFPLTKRSKLVRGEPYMRMKEVDGEANSESTISIIQKSGDLSLYQLMPHTGKKHQLRVHMASLGIPIMNDRLYPEVRLTKNEAFIDPLKLLAKKLEFVDPLSGLPFSFESNFKLELK